MRTARLSFTLVTALTAAFVLPAAAHANDPSIDAIEYVAMGDSFASGAGAGDYADASTNSWKGGDCLQSENGYGPLLAAQLGASLNFQSCSGAVVADVRADQLPALSSSTDLVTLSVGGNDVGFSDVIITCTTSGTSGCTDKVEEAEADAEARLPGMLADLYAEIDSRAPNAQVLILGYPLLFSGRSCFGNTGVNLDEQARINEANYVLNGITKTAAVNAGFTYVDPIPAFRGFGVCTSGAYVNGLKLNIPESYHPNRNGHGIGFMTAINANL